MPGYGVRAALSVLLAGSLLLGGCGGGGDGGAGTAPPTPAPTTEPVAAPADDDAVTSVLEEPTHATEEPEEEEEVEIDWASTTYRMRAYPGSDVEDLTFVDGISGRTGIIEVTADPTEPSRVAMVSTSGDSEGYPLVVNAGIFRMDGSGVALPEAELSTMTGWAIQAWTCTTELTWGGGERMTLDVGACEDGGSADWTAVWTREGDTLALDDSGSDPALPAAADDTDGALDVAGYQEVDFSSPSGAIACKMAYENGGWAVCHFPPDMDRAGLPGPDHCGPTSLAAVGVGSEAGGVPASVGWVCTGGVIAMPDVGSLHTSWFTAAGWPAAVSTRGGYPQTTAAVPYGSSLTMGLLTCSSAEDGVRCARSDSGAGFKVAREGVEMSGPAADHFTGW